MKVNYYDLLDTYEADGFALGSSCDVSQDKIVTMTRSHIGAGRRGHFARIAVIAAALIFCLGTTVLATTDVLGMLSQFLSSSLDIKFGGSGNSGREVVATVDSGTDLNVSMYNGESVLIANDGSSWYFTEGQKVEISTEIQTPGVRVENDPGYSIDFGCIRCDGEGNAIERQDIYHAQIFDTATYTYEIPKTGYYYFYFQHVSSDRYKLQTFEVKIVE